MSQNLRVALWIPNVDPAAVGNAIRTTNVLTANKRIPSEFSSSGTGGVDFADQGEVTAGTVANEAISPLTLRNDNARILDMPSAAFLGAVAIQTSAGPGSANRLVKTNPDGVVDHTMVALDGGVF